MSKTAEVLEQYLNKVSLERYDDIKLNKDEQPETNVSGDYTLEAKEGGVVLARTQVNVHCTHKQNKLFDMSVVYEALIDRGDLTDEEFSVFVNLEYPPVILTDARRLIADLTAETGLFRLSIDPWDFVRQFLAQITKNEGSVQYQQ